MAIKPKELTMENVQVEWSEKARKARREYHAKWQRENKERVKLYQIRHWEKKTEEQEKER